MAIANDFLGAFQVEIFMKEFIQRHSKLVTGIGFAVLLVVSLWVRLVNFHALYPYFYYQDELRHAEISLSLIQDKKLQPDFYLYPHFTIYLTSLTYAGYFFIKDFSEIIESRRFQPIIDSARHFDHKSWTSLKLMRSLSLTFGILAVIAFFLLARSLLGNGFGLASALLFSLFPLSVSLSQLAKVDIFMICFQILSWYFQVRIIRKGRTLDYILAGAFAALCFDSKINFFPGLSYVLAILIRAKRDNEKSFFRIFNLRSLSGIFSGSALALLCSPFYFLHFAEVIKNVGWIYFSTEWVPYWHFDPHHLWTDKYYYSLIVLIPSMVSLPVWILAIAGIFQKIFKNDFQEWLLILFCFFAFIYTFDSSAGSYFYYLYFYLLPLIALFSVSFLRWLFINSGWGGKALTLACLGLILVISFSRFNFYYRMNFQAYESAGAYLARELKPGTKVLSFSVHLPGPALNHLDVNPAWPQDLSKEMIERENPDYILIDRWNFAGFQKFYREKLRTGQDIEELLAGKWGYSPAKSFVVRYPGDAFYQWLDPEFLVELDLLKREQK